MYTRSPRMHAAACAGACLILSAMSQPAHAGITVSGDVSPDPATLIAGGAGNYIGMNHTGSLTIDDGSLHTARSADLGYSIGSVGTATVTGPGSRWEVERWLTVGGSGNGTLNILQGGEVHVQGETHVAERFWGTGNIYLDLGTLTTGSLYADFADLTGTGTLNTQGLIADDFDVVFDSAHGPTQTFVLDQLPGQDLTVHLDQNNTGILGAGYDGGGSLTIRDGVEVNSYAGVIGYQAGSSGSITVDGAGSTWNITRSLKINGASSGELHILNGGVVNVSIETVLSAEGAAAGSIHFDNGRLNTQVMHAASDQLHGRGTIYTTGLIVEGGMDLFFDASHGTNQIIRLNDMPGQDITIHLDTLSDGLNIIGAGWAGEGTLAIRDGVSIYNHTGYVGYLEGSNGTATVSGPGTRWQTGWLAVGVAGNGELTIRDHALVMAETLTMNVLGDYYGNTSYINLANGGMLAIEGDVDDSIMAFYESIYYSLNGWSDALRYWDSDLNAWTGLTGATPGEDYTLQYHDSGELAGYTLLTVNTVPEPYTLSIFGFGLALCLHRRRL